jgi:hypothetical protein
LALVDPHLAPGTGTQTHLVQAVSRVMNSLHNGNAHERESSWKALSGGSLQHGTCSAPGT